MDVSTYFSRSSSRAFSGRGAETASASNKSDSSSAGGVGGKPACSLRDCRESTESAESGVGERVRLGVWSVVIVDSELEDDDY